MNSTNSVSYQNLFFLRSGFPLNLTLGKKNADFKYACIVFFNANDRIIICQIFVDFFDFDLDVAVIFSAAALAAGLLEERVFVSCK